MHPVICVIGQFTIYSFGLMLAIAVFVCSYFLGRDVQKIGVAKEVAYDLVFWTAFAGVIGSRLFFILLNLDLFTAEPLEILMIQHGGLAWQGGLIFGMTTAFIYLRIKRLPFLKFLDIASPYAALGQAIGRIGCFMNGCCYGKPVWWGPYFPVHDANLHPTQIYESAGLFLIFILLKKRNATVPGRVFAVYLMSAAVLRFVVQFFRDDRDPVWFGLSVFQWVCMAVLIGGIAFYQYLKRPARERI